MDYTFNRDKRLLNSAQFKQVFTNKQKKTVTEMVTFYFCYQNLSHPRLGVIVPKKHVANSSLRVFFKRTIREFFRLNQNRLARFDLLVLVNRKIKGVSREEIKSKLKNSLNEILC